MTEENPNPKSNFGERLELALRTFIRGLLRLLLIVIVAIGIGLAFYYGVPYLYRQFILPVQTNTAQLQEIQASQAQTNQQVNQRLEQLQSRLTALENQGTLDTEAIAELRTRLSMAEQSLEDQAATLARLDELQARLNQLQQQVDYNKIDSDLLAQEVHATASPYTLLSFDVQMIKVMELISHGRLYLIHNNLGLAREDIFAAQQLLVSLQAIAPTDQLALLTALIKRMDLVVGNLPGAPVLAADDLEIAWKMLVIGQSGGTDLFIEPTLSPADNPTPTLIPTSTAWVTPTPSLTPFETPTAISTATATLPADTTLTPTPIEAATLPATATPTLTPTPGA
jgi:hypothetical protein